MCINKDLKTAVVHPTKTYLQKTTLFFNYHIKSQKNLIRQLFPERFTQTTNSNTILDSTSQAHHREENIQQMCSTISTCSLLPPQLQTNHQCLQWTTGNPWTIQWHAHFPSNWNTGIQDILHQPSSVNAPIRRHKLLTMASVKSTQKKTNQKEQKAKQVINCLRWCNHTKLPYNSQEKKYSVLPWALADEDGNPKKASKSNWTDKLETRYQSAEPCVFMKSLPWVP